MLTGNWNSGYRLYENQGGGGRWLSLELRGGADVNAAAVGSKVYVTSGDMTQLQEARVGSGLGGNNQAALHFGLGAASSAHLRIVWANGDECEIAGVAANQRLRIGLWAYGWVWVTPTLQNR